MVTIGIDTHKATLAVSAIDGTGRETGARTFPNDRQGHVGILRWARLEALRCLKRHLADVVLRTMLADLERSAKPAAMGA